MFRNFFSVLLFFNFVSNIYCVWYQSIYPVVNCTIDTNSINGNFRNFRKANTTDRSRFPTIDRSEACLYIVEGNINYFHPMTNIWYKGSAETRGYFGKSFGDLITEECQTSHHCFLCYEKNCNQNPNISTMIEIPKYSAKNSFKCYHGELYRSEYYPIECPRNECITVHNYLTGFYASTCSPPSLNDGTTNLTALFYGIFPETLGYALDFYTCNISQCNLGRRFDGFIQSPFNVIHEYDNSSFTNETIQISPVSLISRINSSNSNIKDIYTVIGRPFQNAEVFKLFANTTSNNFLFSLRFNIPKSYVSLFVPSTTTEFRRTITLNSNNSVWIVFDGTRIIINGQTQFNYKQKLGMLSQLHYSGEWDISDSYRMGKNGNRSYFISKHLESDFRHNFNCSINSFMKFYTFTHPFSDPGTLIISTIGDNVRGVLHLRFQNSLCEDADIPLFMQISIDTSYSSRYSSVKNISSTFSNTLIDYAQKITIWNRLNGEWYGGKVYTENASYISMSEIYIHYQNLTITIQGKNNFKFPVAVLNKNYEFKYLLVEDPFELLKDVAIFS